MGGQVNVFVGVLTASVSKIPATATPTTIRTAITASASLFKHRHLTEQSCQNHKWVCPNALGSGNLRKCGHCSRA